MLMIRLMRFGRKHQPFFRLVVVPKRSKPTRGKFVEAIGWVDPVRHERSVNAERAKHWISRGAQPSATAWNLFVSEGIMQGAKRPVHARTSVMAGEAGRASVHAEAEATGEESAPAETTEAPEAQEEKEQAAPALAETTEDALQAESIDSEKKE